MIGEVGGLVMVIGNGIIIIIETVLVLAAGGGDIVEYVGGIDGGRGENVIPITGKVKELVNA